MSIRDNSPEGKKNRQKLVDEAMENWKKSQPAPVPKCKMCGKSNKDCCCKPIELPDLPEKEKDEIVKKAIEGSSQLLLIAMKACKVENYITGSIINDENGNLYELTFTKVIKC